MRELQANHEKRLRAFEAELDKEFGSQRLALLREAGPMTCRAAGLGEDYAELIGE